MIKKIFTSKKSQQDAAFKAKMAGFTVIGFGRHPNGTFVAFARK